MQLSEGANRKKAQHRKCQILSFAGCFNDMEQDEYDDFVAEISQPRSLFFERN